MSEAPNNSRSDPSSSPGFWQELRRRKVLRVGSVYVVTGWLIIQVASTTFASFGIPEWAFRFVTLMVLLGLPVALIIAWAFELTPDGIKASTSVSSDSVPSDVPQALVRNRNWHAYALGALLPTMIFGSLAAFFYLAASNSDRGAGGDAALDETELHAEAIESIAVMPLVNMSTHAENAHFAGGIHEDVLTNLSRIDDLQVISRTSMLRYAASELTLREIGQELGVDYIVEGSVRRIGNHVRVTIQLINAHNDVHLWANNFERELVDVFATQSELAREISDSVHLELQPESVGILEGMPTSSVKAYDLYTRAISNEKTEGETQESVVLRREMLEEAVAEDPDFVEAWAVLKRLYDLQLDRLMRRGWYIEEGEDKSVKAEELSARSQRALRKAIALDPENEQTLLAQAVDHNWPKTQEAMEAQRAILDHIIATYPDSAKAWYHLGHWYSHLEDLPGYDRDTDWANAIDAFDRALELDPFNARMVAAVLKWHRDKGYEESLPYLADRLKQIIPETAADRTLARVSWNFRRNQIESAFMATADESLLDEYERGLKDAVDSGNLQYPIFKYWDEVDLLIFKNEQDRLIEMASEPIESNQKSDWCEESAWYPLVFNVVNSAAMAVHMNRGELASARILAKRILLNEEFVLAKSPESVGAGHYALLARAHNVLGNKEDVKRIAELWMERVGPSHDWRPWEMTLLSLFERDRTADLFFGRIAKNPDWVGPDEMAAYHVWSRDFLVYPRIQDYYVKEGKWVDYLSTRVPEYAKYRP